MYTLVGIHKTPCEHFMIIILVGVPYHRSGYYCQGSLLKLMDPYLLLLN